MSIQFTPLVVRAHGKDQTRHVLVVLILLGLSAGQGCGDGGKEQVSDAGMRGGECEIPWPTAGEPFVMPRCFAAPRTDFDPAQPGSHLIVSPAANGCISEGFGTLWLNGQEDLELQVVFGRARDQFPPQYPETIRTVILMDGRQTPFSVDGGEVALTAAHILVAENEPIRMRVRVSAQAISRGVHSLVIVPTGQVRAPVFPLTIVNGGYERQLTSNTPGGEVGAAFGHPVRVKDSGALFSSQSVEGRTSVELVVRLERTVNVCPQKSIGLMAFGVLDGSLVPLSKDAPYLRADVAAGENREFTVPLELKRDGTKHFLRVFLHEAEGELLNDISGTRTVWGYRIPVTQVAAATWL